MIRVLTILFLSCLSLNAAVPIMFFRHTGTNAVVTPPDETNEVGGFYTNMWIDAEDYNYASADTTAGGYFPSRVGTNFNATSTYLGFNALEGTDFEAWDILNDNYRGITGVGEDVHDDGHEPNGVPYTDYKVRAFNANGPDFFIYTRNFSNGTYRIYARVSSTVSFGMTMNRIDDGSWTNTHELQNPIALGTINATGIGTNTFFYSPLKTNGVALEVVLSGEKALEVRMTNGVCDFHRLALVRWAGNPMGFANPEPDPDVVFVDESGVPFHDPENL